MKEEFEKAKSFYYRHLLFIQSERYLDLVFEYVNQFLEVSNSPKVAYAFHPWVEKSKDRFLLFKDKLGLNVMDIDYSSSEKYLGETFDLTILDCVDDFRPNYISRLVDMTRGGGLVVIYSDDIFRNKLYKYSLTRDGIVDNYFEERFIKNLLTHQGIIYVNDGGRVTFQGVNTKELKKPQQRIPNKGKIPKELHKLSASEDQNKTLEELTFLFDDERKRIVAVTAPRGRGKSAVVGIFLAYVVHVKRDEPTNIVITSPSYYSSSEIINFLIMGLKALKIRYKLSTSKDGKIMKVTAKEVTIRWLAPDLAKDYEGYMIVVDEASALGMETLDYIIRSWNKIILVTTIHGYEGSGKAFLKYLLALKQKYLFKHITLSFPIRYAKGDPVERFIYDVMLLDAEPKVKKIEGKFEDVNREKLFKDEGRLRQIYGILVSAHYRNSPDDLMILGDLHFQKIFSIDDIAIAQIIEEGSLPEERIKSILLGESNVGHLIPHRIIKYERVKEFGKLRGWRVQRIAVVPELQGKGLGSKLLSEVERRGKEDGIDWLGSSFVLDYKVLNFWVKNGFYPIYFASRKNEGLNGYSVIVIKPFSEDAKRLSSDLAKMLKNKVLRTAHQVYFNVSPLSLAKLISSIPAYKKVEELGNHYIERITAYLEGILPYNSVADAISLLVEKYFWEKPTKLDDIEEAVLVGRVLQGKSWSHIGLSIGKSPKEIEEILRESVSKLMKTFI